MTKERLLFISELKWFIFKSGSQQTGWIIDVLLPAVRDNEEFKKDFWGWMAKEGYAEKSMDMYFMFSISCYNYDRGEREKGDRDDGSIMIPTKKMLLDYELEFCREILKQEFV